MSGDKSRSGKTTGWIGNTLPHCDGFGTRAPNRMQNNRINAYFSEYYFFFNSICRIAHNYSWDFLGPN